MRVGVVTVMAKVIEFYVPDRFRKMRSWNPPEQRGKVIEFPTTEITGATQLNGKKPPSCHGPVKKMAQSSSLQVDSVALQVSTIVP